jgi:hypothetical protein
MLVLSEPEGTTDALCGFKQFKTFKSFKPSNHPAHVLNDLNVLNFRLACLLGK